MLWSTPEVKQLNKERIRKAIQQNGKCTKSNISKETGLSVATCNNTLNEMLESGEIIKADQEEIVMGRPANRFVYNTEFHHVLGIAITDGDKDAISYAVGDALGHQIATGEKTAEVIDYQCVEELIQEIVESDPLIDSISVGIPGVTHHGIVERCDVKSIIGIPLEENLKERFQMDVEVRNDMEYISCGLCFSTYQGNKNLAVAYFPDGEEAYVGCGFVINGKILKGATRFSGQMQYVPEAFGISTEEQKTRMYKKDSFVAYVSQIVTTIIATIDPEEIILMGNELTEDDKQAVAKICAEIVTEEHVPELAVENDVAGNFMNGLIRAAVNRMDFPLSEAL